MDRDEALKLLRLGEEGVAEWNRRRDIDAGGIDLVKADLARARLAGANLCRVGLDQANLSEADLTRARLDAASLWNANLRRANLAGARLVEAKLCGADLRDANLMDADLLAVDLTGANLERANLMRSNLTEAVLRGIDCRGANLRDADLSYATFNRVDMFRINSLECVATPDLSGADLEGARLWHLDLGDVNLKGASVRNALCGHTSFGAIDLSGVHGLEHVHHNAGSSVATEALRLSHGIIPDVFLRGCGLQKWEVLSARLYDRTLTGSQIAELQNQIFDHRAHGPLFLGGIFISYSHTDSSFVDKIEKRLQEEGAPVWRDIHDAFAGPLERQVFDAIRIKDTVVLVLSEASVVSDWVEAELERAREREKAELRDVLCPIALDDSWKAKVEENVLWRQLKKKNILDFSKWKTRAFDTVFDKLIRGLKRWYPPR